MEDAYIYTGQRSCFGRYGGVLSGIRPDDLLAQVIQGVLQKSRIPADQIEDVIVGCANQAGEDARNIARHAAMIAGIPETAAAITVNRLCGSGLASIADAARSIMCGQGDLILAGGVESMSRAPFVFSKAESPFDRQPKLFDSTMGARFPNPVFEERFGADTMPQTADNIAREFGVTRDQSDRFAFESQRKYETANTTGFFDEEILPISVKGKGGKNSEVAADEHARPGTTIEKLATLRALNPNGVVTAGSASGVNDGAAAVLVGTLDIGKRNREAPSARIVSAAVAGVAPRLMGLGPVPAIGKALERASLTIGDIDVIEINEAFAPQVLGCLLQLGIDFSDERVNPNGGAIAVGHPLGASGTRLAVTAIRQLQKINGRFALVSMCIGLGQGIALILERQQ